MAAPCDGGSAACDGGSDEAREAAAARVRERLVAAEGERRACAETRRAAAAAAADPRESVAAFEARADARRAQVEGALAALEAAASSAPEGASPDVAAARAAAEAVRATLLEFEQDIAASAYFLPKYDARSAAATVAALRERCAAAEAAAAPRRKFAFGAARRAAPAPPGDAVPDTAAALLEACALSAPAAAPVAAPAAPSGAGFRGARGGVHVLRQAQVGPPDSDFTLEDLQDCDVFVLAATRALRLRSLRRVRVYAAAIAGSAFVDGAAGCALHLAARQVRIHGATDTDFYLRVRSHPIIEDTVRARFAPYALPCAFPGGAAALAAAGLGESDEAAWGDEWRRVDDFAWLRATPSPNWAVMPPAERQAPPPLPAPAPGEEDADGEDCAAAVADAPAAADDEL